MFYSKFYNGIGSIFESNKFPVLQNCDVHSVVGSVQCQYALAQEQATEPSYIEQVTNGDAYLFSISSGKIGKRAISGAYTTTVHTNANGAHKGGRYFNGKLYYASDTKLGYYDLSSTWSDSWQTLNSAQHPMFEFDEALYIGNGRYVASVDKTGTFTSNALDLPQQYEIVGLKSYGDDLLVLANADYTNDTRIYRWNTTDQSWTISDAVKEPVFGFIDADNETFVIAVSGMIYRYNGTTLYPFKQMPVAFSAYNHALSTNYKGRPLIAQGTQIYSLYRGTPDRPIALVGEYTASATITSIRAVGDNLLVSTSSGIENVTANRAAATITTPVAYEKVSNVNVGYYSMPSGCSIGIEVAADTNTFTSRNSTNWATDMVWKMDEQIETKRFMQTRITLTPNGSDTPVIDSIYG